MKKALKWTLRIVGVLALLVLAAVAFVAFSPLPKYSVEIPNIPNVEITPERVARGEKLSAMLCNSCHMDNNTGLMTGRALSEAPQFGVINSKNITHDPVAGIGSWTDAQLIYFIRTGIHPLTGRYVPPYMPKLVHISDEELKSIVAYLRSDHPSLAANKQELPESQPSFLTKFLCRVAFKPFPYPTQAIPEPDTTNTLELGKYIALYQLECYACHSKDFKTNDYFYPEKSEGFFGGGNLMMTMEGEKIYTKNLTMDVETGLGAWTKEQFALAVRTGISPNGGMALRYPMLPYTRLTDKEVDAVWEYLKTVPKISNKVE